MIIWLDDEDDYASQGLPPIFKSGWYFQFYQRLHGPYDTKEYAESLLKEMKDTYNWEVVTD